jgi:bacteriocin-like protein
MSNQNPTKSDTKDLTIAQDDSAEKAGEQPEIKKELTDEELASVAGGHTGALGAKSGIAQY